MTHPRHFSAQSIWQELADDEVSLTANAGFVRRWMERREARLGHRSSKRSLPVIPGRPCVHSITV